MTHPFATSDPHSRKGTTDIERFMNFLVLVLSVALIVWISFDTFRRVNVLENHTYMTFQFWVCIVFILDFFIELQFAPDKWRYFRHRIVFLLLSIPYLNIINLLDIQNKKRIDVMIDREDKKYLSVNSSRTEEA